MHIPRKAAIALLAGVTIAGVATASASSLGGLTPGTLGSDSSVIAACDTDGIAISYTTGYNATTQKYEVSAVNFSGVNAACTGKAASVTLRNGTTALATQSSGAITVTTNAFALTLTTAVDANLVNGVSLVISG